MKLVEMFWDLAVDCGSITRFLLSTACALFFTLSTNFMVGAVNCCRDILVEEIGLERVKIGTIHFVALSRPILFTWRSWQPLYMVPGKEFQHRIAAAPSKTQEQACPSLKCPSFPPPPLPLRPPPPPPPHTQCSIFSASLTRSCRSRWPRATPTPSTWATTTSSPSRTSRRRQRS